MKTKAPMQTIKKLCKDQGFDFNNINDLIEDIRAADEKARRDSKTTKQVASGYHRPVCVACQVEMRPDYNGAGLLDYAEWGPYELWDTDIWKCPKCGIKVVGGFASNPISAHFEDNFKQMIEHYKSHFILIENHEFSKE